METETRESIWVKFDKAFKRENSGASVRTLHRRFSWVVQAMVPLALCLAVAISIMLPLSLSANARLSLLAFAFSVILWSTTRLNATFVALSALVFLVLTGGASEKMLFESLASDVIWLMIGAFVLSEAIRSTGLAGRLTSLVVKRNRSVKGIFWLLTLALIPLTFFIPSTSGRGAVILPVFKSISESAQDKRITRALSLLLPSVILVLTICTLIGAGSHLIANDLLQQKSGKSISFLQWIIYGMPFGAITACFTCLVVLRMFLNKTLRNKEVFKNYIPTVLQFRPQKRVHSCP